MEDPAGRSYSTEEKDKLKEKLALLKKEYKRTFNRLQRSQRAERVKTHVKKTIAEQNLLLSQEVISSITDDLLNEASNIPGNVAVSQSIVQTIQNDAERKTSVTFNLQPEILHVGGSSSQCSGGSASSGQDIDVAHVEEGTGLGNSGSSRKSRLRLRRTSKRIYFTEPSPPDTALLGNRLSEPEDLQDKFSTIVGSLSPVFKKTSQIVENQKTEAQCDATVLCTQNKRHKDAPAVNGSPCSLGIISTIHNSPTDFASNNGHITEMSPCLLESKSIMDKVNKQNCVNSAKSLGSQIAAPLPVTYSPVTEVQDKITDTNSNFGVSPPMEFKTINSSSCKLSSVHYEESPVHDGSVKVVEENNPLSSCTLVEGLLFPVEYYVRTTRRMSSCQRKVDLDAVIQSHLGSNKRGLRGRRKQSMVSGELDSPLISPSPGDCIAPRSVSSTLSLTPLNHPSASFKSHGFTHSRRGRGRRSTPPQNISVAEISSCLQDVSIKLQFDGVTSPMACGSQSEKENYEEPSQTKVDPLSRSLILLNHPSTSIKSRGVTHSRRGRGRRSIPTPDVSSSLQDVSVKLQFDGVTSPAAIGSQSEKENCEEPAQSTIDPLSGPICFFNAESSKLINGSKHDESYVLPQSNHTAYALRPRLTPSHCAAKLSKALEGPSAHKGLKQTNNYAVGSDSSQKLDVMFLTGSLKELPIRLKEIRDFHLPDEEFGVLKLKKMKSRNLLESFDPKPVAGRKRRAAKHQKSVIEQSVDSSTVMQTAQQDGSDPLEQDDVTANTNTDHLNDMESTVLTGHNLLDSLISLKNYSVPSSERPVSQFQDTMSQDSIIQPAQRTVSSPTMQQSIKDAPFSNSWIYQNYLFPPNQSSKEENCATLKINLQNEAAHSTSPVSGVVKQRITEPFLGNTLFPSGVSSAPINGPKTSTQTQAEAQLQPDIVLSCPSLSSQTELEPSDCGAENCASVSLPPPKELSCSVLFSTSVCSMPLDATSEGDYGTCTPGFPLLGITPAAGSLPLNEADLLTPCSFTLQTPVNSQSILVSPDQNAQEKNYSKIRTEDEENKQQNSELAPGSFFHYCEDSDTVEQSNKLEAQCETKNLQIDCNLQTCDKNSDQVLTNQPDFADIKAKAPEGNGLHLVSQIQDSCGGGCTVDLCSAWWEFSDCAHLCIMAASEFSVCLWRPLGAEQWEAAHTWNFMEMPIIQILPLPEEANIVCVALGNLEIKEIWALYPGAGSMSYEQRAVKRGHTKTALGLSRARIVSGSGVRCDQVVEITHLSKNGRIVESRTLMSPGDSILSFSELEGEKDALVGCTVSNSIVIWNSVTGQLLSTFHVGDLCHSFSCLSASSESGLLFLVLASPYSSDDAAAGSCVFRLIAANPKSEQCVPVTCYNLPDGHTGRYLEGDVKNHSAAAVLSCGSIALWDLSQSLCCTVLPPSPDMRWCLVRWAQNPSYLLAGQKDGAVCVYRHSGSALEKMRTWNL
ncbi:partner and localizer of BRCA2 isoform X2 [Bombina bombina]|uniref:partner and localizer of BRCA2 isoform X2 n=1 Tax=Bombina bombina TaxID=8345 RepID=UPI00235AD25E|nr:partner and localizer of BRCA2 isoform X2 [Bombina bombina]